MSCILTKTLYHFFQVSRDRKVVVWGGESWKPVGTPLTLADSVTAVAVAGKKEGGLLVACGLDSGSVCLVDWTEGSWGKEVDTLDLHLATVTRLAFRPKAEENKVEEKEGRVARVGAVQGMESPSISSIWGSSAQPPPTSANLTWSNWIDWLIWACASWRPAMGRAMLSEPRQSQT